MVKIYSALISDYSQADYTNAYSLLDCALREKIDAKQKTQDILSSLVGYMLFYSAVKELYNRTDVKINFNKHGKPLCELCFFSISHSHGRVVCVISDTPIGVDIQRIKDIKKREKYKFFNEQENFYVNQSETAYKQKYIEVFTKKEAAVKMKGDSIANAGLIDVFSPEFSFTTEFEDDFVLTICTMQDK